jgi:hypothetical protein
MSESSESENKEVESNSEPLAPNSEQFDPNSEQFDPNYKKSGLLTRGRMSLAVIAVFFMFLIVAGEVLQFTDLLGVNGITRGDVAKYRLHVLNIPMLEKVLIKPTTVNVTAEMDQLGTSDVFRAHDDNGHHAYFRMNQNYDFENIEPVSTGAFPLSPDAPPHYDFDFQQGKTVIERNDRYFTELNFPNGGGDPKARESSIINYGRSAVTYVKRNITDTCIYLERLSSPTAQIVPGVTSVLQATADPYGQQFFALTAPPKSKLSDPLMYLVGVNFDKKEADGNYRKVTFDVPLTTSDIRLHHSSVSRSLTIIDADHLRIIDASDGKLRADYQLVDKKGSAKTEEKSKQVDQNDKKESALDTVPKFTIIPGVPAAIFGNKLIDLRSGEVVDTLDGYGKNSVFTVDFINKKLYYSTCDDDDEQKPTMNVAIYDLHEIKLDFQVTLAGRIIVGDEAIERDDGIKNLFIRNGKLIALSGPR